LLHSVAFAPKDALEGISFPPAARLSDCHDVSAYSLIASPRGCPLMTEGAASSHDLLWLRESRAHYNVMGVAKASLEASTATSPTISARKKSVSTASAPARQHAGRACIAGFTDMLKHYEAHARSSVMFSQTNSVPPAHFLPATALPPSRARSLRGLRLSNHGDVIDDGSVIIDIFATYAPSTPSANGSNSLSFSSLNASVHPETALPLPLFSPLQAARAVKRACAWLQPRRSLPQ